MPHSTHKWQVTTGNLALLYKVKTCKHHWRAVAFLLQHIAEPALHLVLNLEYSCSFTGAPTEVVAAAPASTSQQQSPSNGARPWERVGQALSGAASYGTGAYGSGAYGSGSYGSPGYGGGGYASGGYGTPGYSGGYSNGGSYGMGGGGAYGSQYGGGLSGGYGAGYGGGLGGSMYGRPAGGYGYGGSSYGGGYGAMSRYGGGVGGYGGMAGQYGGMPGMGQYGGPQGNYCACFLWKRQCIPAAFIYLFYLLRTLLTVERHLACLMVAGLGIVKLTCNPYSGKRVFTSIYRVRQRQLV